MINSPTDPTSDETCVERVPTPAEQLVLDAIAAYEEKEALADAARAERTRSMEEERLAEAARHRALEKKYGGEYTRLLGQILDADPTGPALRGLTWSLPKDARRRKNWDEVIHMYAVLAGVPIEAKHDPRHGTVEFTYRASVLPMAIHDRVSFGQAAKDTADRAAAAASEEAARREVEAASQEYRSRPPVVTIVVRAGNESLEEIHTSTRVYSRTDEGRQWSITQPGIDAPAASTESADDLAASIAAALETTAAIRTKSSGGSWTIWPATYPPTVQVDLRSTPA